MKKIKILLLIVFASLSSYAQDPQLFENTWYLQKVVIDGNDIFPPNVVTEQITGTIQFFELIDIVSINYCDFTDSLIEYDLVSNIFTLQDNPSILIGDCLDSTNITFGINYFSVFFNSQHFAKNPFSYSFTTENGILTLTVVNSLGDIAIYGNEILSIQYFDNLSFEVYPNPVKDELFIASKTSINDFNIFIYSINGKLILSINDSELSNNSIDVQKFNRGIYFMRFEDNLGRNAIRRFIKN